MNRNGFTLLEVVIFIALFAIISLILGKQLGVLINNYARDKESAKQGADSRDIISIMEREIRNTGLKVYLQPSGSSYTRTVADQVKVNPATDLSSFKYTHSTTSSDEITIIKARLDNSTGNLAGIDTVRYYLSGTTLMRDWGPPGEPKFETRTLAENVYALKFQYGIIAANTGLFDEAPLVPADWTPSGSLPTLTIASATTGNIKYNKTGALEFTISKNEKYSVLLQIDPSAGFPANLNYLSFTFKKKSDNTVVGTEKFLPYGGTMQISVGISESATAYAFLEYNTKGAGTLLIKGIEVTKTSLGTYSWTYSPTTAEKQNTRAIRVYVLTRSAGKTEIKNTAPITVGDITVTPSSVSPGNYSWRLFTDMIEIPNNGSL